MSRSSSSQRSVRSSRSKSRSISNSSRSNRRLPLEQAKFTELIEDEIVEHQQGKQMQIEFNPDSLVFEILPLTIGIQGIQQMPVALNVDAKKQITERAALDLICVVDVSGSMSGEKLNLVKNSLRYIQKILSSQDRMSIITFNSNAQLQMTLTRNTEERKQFIKDNIMSMHASGGTDIATGMEYALDLIANRKYRNPITTIFLLSDGNSQGKPVQTTEKLLHKYAIKEPFDLACFGYGADHDANALDSIAQLKQGTFTYIKDIQRACEYFILSMSSMLSVYASKVEILIRSNWPYRITKFYGEGQMITKLEDNNYSLSQNYVLSGQSRQYLFILEWDQVEDNEISVVATFKGRSMNDEEIFKQSELILNQGQIEKNEFVELNYLRAKAGDSIEQARQLAAKKQFDEANQVLDGIINEIANSAQNQSKSLQNVLKDLERSKQVCNPKNFQQEGEAVLRKNMRHHIQRQRSASNSDSWDSDQESLMRNYQQGKLQLSRSASPEQKQQSPRLRNQNKRQQSRSGSPGSRSPRRRRSQDQSKIKSPQYKQKNQHKRSASGSRSPPSSNDSQQKRSWQQYRNRAQSPVHLKNRRRRHSNSSRSS